jgi:DNA-binding response OmpR family regulator
VIRAAEEFHPELVLLDSSLDDGDALELLDQLRTGCPVIVMTEFQDETTPAAALARGAVKTVGKPFKPTVLARTVLETLTSS